MTRTRFWFGCLVLAAALAVPIAALARAPASVSATCKDGTTFTGTSRRGACHGHGGVQSWTTATEPTATTAPSSASVSAICRDGTAFTGATRRGACRGHGGVQSWTTAAAPTATTAPPSASVSATCRDGTAFTGATRRGACRGHGGVQTWTTVTAPAATPPNAPTTTAIAPSGPAASTRGTQNVNNPMPGQVWVNTTSKVYHCPGDRYYGKTKHGEYLSETAAKAEGDRPSRGKTCS
jgi:rhodanese-related sulfurtransferase